jgi:hypothetical protein
MEIKFGEYVWWGKSVESIQGMLTKIEPSMDKNTRTQRKTEDGRLKFNIVIDSPEHNKELKITIIESQRVFWDKQVGKYGIITHNPTNNYLTFEEKEDPHGVQSTLADYDFDLVELSHGEEQQLSVEVLERMRNEYEVELGEIKQKISALNQVLETLRRGIR